MKNPPEIVLTMDLPGLIVNTIEKIKEIIEFEVVI